MARNYGQRDIFDSKDATRGALGSGVHVPGLPSQARGVHEIETNPRGLGVYGSDVVKAKILRPRPQPSRPRPGPSSLEAKANAIYLEAKVKAFNHTARAKIKIRSTFDNLTGQV